MALGRYGAYLNIISGIDSMEKENFIYKELDIDGYNTLDTLSSADKFNKWMYQSIKPFLKGNIIEIGSGIGNITSQLINDKLKVTASDVSKNYCYLLKERFGKNYYINEVRNINIVHPDFDKEYHDLLGKFDSLFALNIIEHVEDDKLAILNCIKLLNKNGHLVILVPGFPSLYNHLDRELNHFRRYTKFKIEELLTKSDIKIVKTTYFNFIGILGWWFNGKILNKKTLPKRQMKLFNLLVPIFKIADRLIFYQAGLSLITCGTKL